MESSKTLVDTPWGMSALVKPSTQAAAPSALAPTAPTAKSSTHAHGQVLLQRHSGDRGPVRSSGSTPASPSQTSDVDKAVNVAPQKETLPSTEAAAR